MKRLSLFVVVVALLAGITSANAAADKAFLPTLDKAMKISGQMASGKVPYNPVKAVKVMKNIQDAVTAFETKEAAGAPKNVVDCAALLKKASLKGAAAAKAGQGAFKAAYGDLLTGYKLCTK